MILKGLKYDVKTGKLEETEEYIDDAEYQRRLEEANRLEQKRIRKEQAKQSAIEKLKQLGLTEEEIEALRG